MTSAEADGIFYDDFVEEQAPGMKASMASDFNHDGHDDLVLSRQTENVVTSDGQVRYEVGRAWIFEGPLLGRHELAAVQAQIQGELPQEYLGWALATGSDLTGDGIEDLVIGAPGAGSSAISRTGEFFVYSVATQSELNHEDAASQVTAEEQDSRFGEALSSGDSDGDGKAEVAVGASHYTVNGSQVGAVFIFDTPLRNETNTGSALAIIQGAGGDFGTSLDMSGDLNHDGKEDLIVGAGLTNTIACQEGAVYGYFGPLVSTRPLSSADFVVEGDRVGGWAGTSVGTGDVNGDGIGDLVIGAPGNWGYCHPNEPSTQGFAYLFYGPLQGKYRVSDADATIEGDADDVALGQVVLVAADLNSDGRNEVILACPKSSYTTTGGYIGSVYLFFQPLSGHYMASEADATIEGTILGELFGSSLATGDINNDGFDDLVSTTGGGYTTLNQAYLFLGGPTPELHE